MPKRLFWAVESLHGSCTRYRVIVPGRHLRRAGWIIEVADKVQLPLKNFNYDLVVMQRNAVPQILSFMASVGQLQIPIAYDMDDDIFMLEDTNPVFNLYLQRPDIPWSQLNGMRFADALFVSTPALRDAYRCVQENPLILPNYMDAQDWLPGKYPQALRFEPETVALVWAGSNTHAASLATLAPALEATLLRYPQVVLVTMGMDSNPFTTLPRERVLTLGWGSYQTYQGVLAACQIGLAPLAPNRFNRAKSNLRLMEYASAGLAIVASAYGEYDCPASGAFLCQNSEDWEFHLANLIEQDDLRQERARLATQWVREQMDIRAHLGEWEQALEGVTYHVS